MTSHTLYVWHPIQYACYHNNCLWHYTPLCITSHPVYLWHHIQYVLYQHTAFMTTQWLYLTSHRTLLTPQPLYLCHHTNGRHICIDVALYQWLPNKCVSHHTWHTYDIIRNLHHITFTLYVLLTILLLAFAQVHFIFQGQACLLLLGSLDCLL